MLAHAGRQLRRTWSHLLEAPNRSPTDGGRSISDHTFLLPRQIGGGGDGGGGGGAPSSASRLRRKRRATPATLPRCRAPYRWSFRVRTADSHGATVGSGYGSILGGPPISPIRGPRQARLNLHAGHSRSFVRARHARATLTWESRDVRGSRGRRDARSPSCAGDDEMLPMWAVRFGLGAQGPMSVCTVGICQA